MLSITRRTGDVLFFFDGDDPVPIAEIEFKVGESVARVGIEAAKRIRIVRGELIGGVACWQNGQGISLQQHVDRHLGAHEAVAGVRSER